MPKVSVIIPVYNVEEYLRQCLDSVLNQTLRDIEIICVDDGSTDGSAVVLEEYAAKDSRIKIIAQENAGAGAARNVGLNIAGGQYLYFCDPDDWCRTDMLLRMVEAADTDASDVVICGRVIYDAGSGRRLGSVGFPDKVWALPGCFDVSEISDIVFSVTRGTVWDKLFRRDLIVRLRLNFQDLRRNNDLLFANVAIAHARKISVVRRPLYCHRVNRVGSLQKNTAEARISISLAWNAVEDRLKKDGLWARFAESCENSRLHDARHQGFTSSDKFKMTVLSWIPFGVKGCVKKARYKLSKSGGMIRNVVRCCRRFVRSMMPYAIVSEYRNRRYGVGKFSGVDDPVCVMDRVMDLFHKILPACLVESYLRHRNRNKPYSAQTIKDVMIKEPDLYESLKASLTGHSQVSFSVVLPTYNRVHVIERAIDSVLNQTARNVELIIVDDGSTDGTGEFIRLRYQSEIREGKIIYTEHENQGVSKARNIGLSKAKGSWVVYIDSDNVLKPYALDVYAEAIESNPGVKVLYSKFELMSTGIECGRDFSFEEIVDRNYIDLGVFVHHSSLCAELGCFDENLRRLVDWDLIVRYARVYCPMYLPIKTMCYNDLSDAGRISGKEDYDLNYKLVKDKMQRYG